MTDHTPEAARAAMLRELDQLIEALARMLRKFAQDGDTRRFADQAVHGAAALALEAAAGRIDESELEVEIGHLWAQLKSVALLSGLELREEAQAWLDEVLTVLTLALKASLTAALA